MKLHAVENSREKRNYKAYNCRDDANFQICHYSSQFYNTLKKYFCQGVFKKKQVLFPLLGKSAGTIQG